MMQLKTLWLLIFAMPLLANSQPKTFDRLVFTNPPEGWSTQMLNDRLIFSNENIRGAEAITASIFKGNKTTEKPAVSFAKYWQQYFKLSDTATAPKTRRLYNNDGVGMLLGGLEMELNNEKNYYQFTMYYDETYTQLIVIKATSFKAYKPVQYEWFEKLQAVTFLKK